MCARASACVCVSKRIYACEFVRARARVLFARDLNLNRLKSLFVFLTPSLPKHVKCPG